MCANENFCKIWRKKRRNIFDGRLFQHPQVCNLTKKTALLFVRGRPFFALYLLHKIVIMNGYDYL